MQTENYLLTVYRYIELSLVRATMDDHASEYPWSSYRYNAAPHREYTKLGREADSQQKAYRQLFRVRMAEKDLDEIRDCTNKSRVLGDERFKVKVQVKKGISSQRV